MLIEQAKVALKQYFGYDSFRPMQEEIIGKVVEGKDVVVLMPTGGGKSLCYQIPALVMDGVAVVISPLIALMQDQVESLRANGVNAEFINSTQSPTENTAILHAALDGKIDLLYVSPEKALSPDFAPALQQIKICLFAVDEAHCISSWGHDFRPEYTQLSFLKDRFPKVPMIALTATADKLTRRDIQNQLHLREPELFLASFDRPNISLNVMPGQNRFKGIVDWIQQRPGQSGIIYCLARKTTESISKKLKEKGIKAGFYHAGMGPKIRAKAQQDFIRDDMQIICATIAFGMGIDKSNIRWVIHYNLPKNIESYYQEIGRAGRDGLPSDTLLFYSFADVIQLRKFMDDSSQREIGMLKLERMQQFANAGICRRKVLLSYFSEHLPENCNNCDVCKDPPETIDGTVMVQKSLSAMMRMNERVGMGLLIDVLRGSARQEIRLAGYDRIKTYGAGADVPKNDWQNYILQMLDQGLVEIAYDEGNTLKMTPAGKAVLFEGKKVDLVKKSYTEPKAATTSRKKGKARGKLGKLDDQLFQRLRVLRKKMADKQGIPPYIIFHDASLKQMASDRPSSEVKMRNISGVGDRKMQLYGDQFINEILQFIQEKSAEGRVVKGGSQSLTYELYRQGKSIAEISAERGLGESTVYSHLAELYATGDFEIDLFKFLSIDELQSILTVVQSVGPDKGMKPIFDHFGGEMSYHKIRLAVAYLERNSRTSS